MHKKGIINPYEFIENFGHLDIPKIINVGEYNLDLIDSVRQNKFNLKEGVICKGVFKDRNGKDIVWMSKIKTNEWLLKVKEKLGNYKLMEELNNDSDLFKLVI